MYRDHRKGPGGPPGGATYPGGPHGLKWGREPAPGGLVRPPGPPLRLGLEILGVGGRPTWLGGQATPLAAAPLGDGISQGRRPLGGLYKGGEGGQPDHSPWRLPLPPVTPLPLVGAWRSPVGVLLHQQHHAIVLPWSCLPQPLLPPCWIKTEETSPVSYVC